MNPSRARVDHSDQARFAEVVVTATPDRLYHYEIPSELSRAVRPGVRVRVPFGARVVDGYVVRLAERTDVEALKPVIDVLDARPIIDATILQFSHWIADYYLAPWGRVLTAVVPSGLKARAVRRVAVTDAGRAMDASAVRGEARRRLLTILAAQRGPVTLAQIARLGGSPAALPALVESGWVSDHEGSSAAPRGRRRLYASLPPDGAAVGARVRGLKQQAVLDSVTASGGAFVSDLGPGAAAVCRSLAAKGALVLAARETVQDPYRDVAVREPVPVLTESQQQAVDAVCKAIGTGTFSPFLLWGVTGSGKTEVYLRAMAAALDGGRSALLLVPEISLTSQIVGRVRGRFGDTVAVLHSGLSNAERLDAWERVRRGAARIALGTRSALFAPLPRLGLIVIDEEHDGSYKQEDGVRYQARDSALVLGREFGAAVVLGSATPSLETYANARSGRYRLLSLPERVETRPLPTVRVVDLRSDDALDGLFSRALREAIAWRLDRREQVILVLNRRGFAPVVVCRDCGTTVQCERCSVGLTFHRGRGRLCCHYCGLTTAPRDRCAECGGHRVMLEGVGTEQVEARVRAEWPQARVARMDRDTTGSKLAHDALLAAMRRGDADVLVGTQMVAKGHDLPNVTLVGIINADVGLSLPDFRAGERIFQLLTQAAGRAGRGDRPGEVILQTRRPSHDVLAFAQRHDVAGFYAREIERRRELGYPPFGRLAIILISGTHESDVIDVAKRLARDATPASAAGVAVLGPAPAPLWRLKGRHRWQLVLKGPQGPAVRRVARALMARAGEDLPRGVRVDVDIDPQHVL
ncbi:MAG: replication restart helicase PriA [Nitrospirota bacterium]